MHPDLKLLLHQMHLADAETLPGLLEALREGGYLSDGSLNAASLTGLDFSGAYLMHADLQGADLSDSCLAGADLFGADLRGARLVSADLAGANLDASDLRGANLSNATLDQSTVQLARLDADSILPDASRWQPGLDLRRFSDPQHPAYRAYAQNRRWHALLRARLYAAASRTQPQAANTLSLADLEAAYKSSGGFCHYCGCRLDQYGLKGGWTIDHKVALAQGGSNSAENIVIACHACNSRKADQSYARFLAWIRAQKTHQQLSLWD